MCKTAVVLLMEAATQAQASTSAPHEAFLWGPGGAPSGAFGAWAAAQQGFLGIQHVQALIKLIGRCLTALHPASKKPGHMGLVWA